MGGLGHDRPSRPVNIYALTEPGHLDVIRYVGATTGEPKLRMHNHLYEAKRSKSTCHRLQWLRSLTERPGVLTLEVADDLTWEEAETRWICDLRAAGHDLTNTAPGGRGAARPLTDEQRAKIPRTTSDKQKQAVSRALSGRVSPTKGMTMSPEARAKISAAVKGLDHSALPKHLKGASRSEKAKWWDEWRRQRAEESVSPEVVQEAK